MGVYISRVQINNFRNFKDLDVHLSKKAVIVGENKSGKTNFIHALQLILDPNLPDSARQLKEEDFWDGLELPMENGIEIHVSIDIQGFENNNTLLAILADYLVENVDNKQTARITYKFAPLPNLGEERDNLKEIKYDFLIYGGDDPSNIFGYQQRKWMPIKVLPALRDAETDLRSWRKSPLRPLIDRLRISKQQLESAANKIDEATNEILNIEEIKSLSIDIEQRLEEMIGDFHSVSPSLGVASTEALRLLKSLRLFVDGEHQRDMGYSSLGICNVLYLTLLVLELESKEIAEERASTILAIEEPEAHLHPHLQRLVYRDFLRRESSILLTTHSPNIVSVSPINSIVLLRNYGNQKGSEATSTAKAEFTVQQSKDLERYLDVTRGEILFSRGVILVEGDAELYVVPAFANNLEIPLDQKGISVCSVHGTDFVPYARLLGENALNIPFVIITDADPYVKNEDTLYRGYIRGIKILKIEKPHVVEKLTELFRNRTWDHLNKELTKYGIFIGEYTLEIDLALSNNKEEMSNTLKELGASQNRQTKFESTLSKIDNLLDEDIDYIINTIIDFGKGRFAQRLSDKLEDTEIPIYIEEAIEKIVKLIENKEQ